MTTNRPQQLLEQASKIFPDRWKLVEKARREREAILADGTIWPDWCFIPTDVWMAIAAERYGKDGRLVFPKSENGEMTTAWAAVLESVGTWRYTKGYYRFDQTLYEELLKTGLKKTDLPSDIFSRLPEYCVYIETPDFATFMAEDGTKKETLDGLFVSLAYNTDSPGMVLRLCLVFPHGPFPIDLDLGGGTIEDALLLGVEHMTARRGIKWSATDPKTGERTRDVKHPVFQNQLKKLTDTLLPIMSLILYICSENPDIMNEGKVTAPEPPRFTKTRHGDRLFQKERPAYWDVGVRLGAALRRAQNKAASEAGAPTGRTVRGHIRRAHWHHYWTGVRGTDERKLIVRWLPPIEVNIDEIENLPLVVRPVVKEEA